MHGNATDTRNYERSKKPWGWQRPILRNHPLHVDEIEIDKGGYCSVHRHLRKVNLFHVFVGKLAVFTFNDGGLVIKAETMEEGDYCVIPAGDWHQFWSETGCLAQEVYYGTEEQLHVLHSDIDRKPEFSEGGIALAVAAMPSMRGVYNPKMGS